MQKQLDPSIESDSGSESDEEDEGESSDDDSDDPANDLIKGSRKAAAQRVRNELKAKKKAEKERLRGLSKERKKKDVNLNRDIDMRGLTSLSGSKGTPVGKGPCHHCDGPHMKRDCPELGRKEEGPCFTCGGPHFKASCPQNKRHHPGGDDGPPRKFTRTR